MKNFGEYCLCLKKREKAGSFTMTPCVLRRLSMDDKDEALAFHRALAVEANHDIFVPGTDENFLGILEGKGIVLGIHDGKRIICMRTLFFQTDDEEILNEDMGLSTAQMKRMAFLDYCIVHSDYRGNNLQFLTYSHIEAFLWDDFDYLYTTVSPRNIVSLRNIINCGFYAFQLKERYGGYMRYLLRKDLKDGSSIRTKRHENALLRDYRAQQDIIGRGKVGYRLVRSMSGLWMAFGTLVK